MLDKLLLNNQLLSSKKKVQQARVNVINKLVQKIRNLKNLNEKKPDDKKIHKKLSKSTNILCCVKKIKTVELLKRALLNTRNPTKIITDGRSTYEEIADAILFNHKIIVEIVNHLKTLLNLNDNNPGWRDEIQELSKKQRKSLRTEKKKQKRQERKDRNEQALKRSKWLEENLSTDVQDKANNHLDVVIKRGTKEIDEDNGWNVEDLSEIKTKNTKQIKKKPQKEFKRIKTEVEEDEIKPLEEEGVVDPFFITATGENYVSTAIVSTANVISNDNDRHDNIKRRSKYHHQQRDENRKQFFNTGKKGKEFSKNRSFTDRKRITNGNANDVKDLHPSWKAKQKQRGIVDFKGTKTLFSNSENDKDDKNTVKKANTNSNSDAADLHPSWAAKQKLKPVIKEFCGKKIVFDDNE